MGVMDWMEGDDEESDTLATDGLGFDEEFDGFEGEMGETDDLDGGDDLGGMGDGLDGEMGGFDGGGGGDDFGGTEVDADTIAEMEDRISELENEVSTISSEMNTVREENKQIGETVEELDETVRKLLDIYEMVTRGINPFVDDAREMGGLEGDGAFGLFEMEDESEEDLDSDVATADAESFFDEDFGDLDAGEDEAELAAEDELAAEGRTDPADALGGEDDSADDDASGGGASFDDLKAEYEENEDWDDLEGEAEANDESEADPETVDPDESLFEAEGESAGESAEQNGTAASPESAAQTAAEASESPPATNGTTAAPSTDSDAYLTELPARYTAESVVLEWTQFLVDVGGAIGAARALRQYRSQEWITREVERTMCEHVRNAATAGETERPRDLGAEHHRESLTYISRLAGDVAEPRSAGRRNPSDDVESLRASGGRTTSGDSGTPPESLAAGEVGDSEARLLEELSAHGGGSRGIRR